MFAKGDETTITLLADWREEFRKVAGLRPNLRKSNIYLAGVNERTKGRLLEMTGFQQGSFPFHYLGILLAIEKLWACNYSALIDVVVCKLTSWLKHTLSYTGKLKLVWIVLQGVKCFWPSILLIQSKVIDKLYAICRSFVWMSKHSPISWTTICLAKEEDGYGVRDLRAWNSALLCRALWNIQCKKNSLWVKWIDHQYLRLVDLWEWQAKPSDSALIKRLLQIRDLVWDQTQSAQKGVVILSNWYDDKQQQGVAKAYQFFQPRGKAKV